MIALEELIEIQQGYIENAKEDWGVDTIVNAARPNLMGGSGNCVDAAIHRKIDILHNDIGVLKRGIRKELDSDENAETNIIRCKRGEVVKTEGYKLCENIIHTVGPQNDENGRWPNTCSSLAVNTLKSCYSQIVKLALFDSNIRKVAVPVISAGNYEFKFKLAFRIGLSEVYNTLLEYKRRDPEMLQYTTLEKIYFVIPDKENFSQAQKIFRKFKRTFKKEKRVVPNNSFCSQLQLLKQIQLYDSQKGYFAISKSLRYWLVLGRTFLFPANYLKDLFGQENWESRRKFVELFAILKVACMACLLWMLCNNIGALSPNFVGGFMLYNLLDTVTYLLALIVLADIQNPSANIIRSLLMLLINYIETGVELASVGYIWLKGTYSAKELLLYSIANIDFGVEAAICATTDNAWFLCINGAVKFFFITLVFGYFTNHLKRKKFRTD